jgi:hypothetical protein
MILRFTTYVIAEAALGTLGSAGCQPAVAGSLPATVSRSEYGETQKKISASCRDQQAGSLCSPALLPSQVVI